MSLSDSELLREFTQAPSQTASSQSAFSRLMDRYIHLVHAAALRQVRSRDLADDVTQAVFIVLSRKAKSVQPDRLPAWLLTTTRFCARDAIKMRARRAHHEQQAGAMTPVAQTHRDASTRAVENELNERLDEALCALKSTEGSAVAIRFLQDKPIAEVAETLGIGTAAAQKMISRAMPKLRAWLELKGVSLSAVPLATVLAEIAAHRAPDGLSGSVEAGLGGAGSPAAEEIAASFMRRATHALWIKSGAVMLLSAAILSGVTLTVMSLNSQPAVSVASPLPAAPAVVAPPTTVDVAPKTLAFDTPFVELVGLRLKQHVSVELARNSSAGAPAVANVNEHQFVELDWKPSPDLVADVGRYRVWLTRSEDADESQRVWDSGDLPAEARSVAMGPPPALAPSGSSTARPAQAVYFAHFQAFDRATPSGGRPIAESTAVVTVKPLEHLNLLVEDIDAGGSVHFTQVLQYISSSSTPLWRGSIYTPPNMRATEMFDDNHQPIEIKTETASDQTRYRYRLNLPVLQGQPILQGVRGDVTNVTRFLANGDWVYQRRWNFGFEDQTTRQLVVVRLPPGATDVRSDRPIQTRLVDGRLQVAADESVPYGRVAAVRFRYRLDGTSKSDGLK